MLGSGGSSLTAALTLMESKGLARTLAEPSLVAMSGQTASYLAGGEFPVPVSQGGTNNGAVTIQYKEFGVRLNITPTILTRNRIAMKVAPEVSDLDFSSGIQVGGVAVPSLIVRRTDTTVELGDGESFVISGLVSSNLVSSINKVPGLGDLPVLGAFFKSTSLRREDKELVMVVTPHVVRPLARDTKLPRLPGAKYDKYDPNFAELILFESGDNDIGFSR
jgi:pilus assembly protein CpaC